MNKWILKMIVLTFVVLLAACGTSENQEGSNAESGKKTLTVYTESGFKPFSYLDKGEVTGFDIDLIDAVLSEAGYEYNLENVGWESMLASVQSGEADLAIAGITMNEDRKQTYDFSQPYFESTHKIVFREGEQITSAKDIKGKKIGVQTGTTGAEAAEQIVGNNDKSISKFESNSLAFMSLQSGDVDVVVTDNVVANEYVKNNPDANLDMITDSETFESEFYGILLPKDTALKEDLDQALQTIMENGTFEEIYQEWFDTKPDTEALQQAAQ
ncbi:glutamine ABC transporter periplasmic-binding protein [Gracilibacillus halophilus YIM-C55.5]|uniref:Glutamine ABC transporter periplasmic-binding protein n=1 Tax=Gracilibacillus halophilus YIM-C55.5 TaxID=1308866 RepID=N4W8S8_9BACI|nr:basic amino acid ABC transporter substrate-binding protein [Gracilibacillus halophilus]ENH95609.1 glutamine ABC transporter periplasmic-binding protein [Gracilibacillus halophilus YIM-C55.5]